MITFMENNLLKPHTMELTNQRRKEIAGNFNLRLDTYTSNNGFTKQDVLIAIGASYPYLSMAQNQLRYNQVPKWFWEWIDDFERSGLNLAEYLKEKNIIVKKGASKIPKGVTEHKNAGGIRKPGSQTGTDQAPSGPVKKDTGTKKAPAGPKEAIPGTKKENAGTDKVIPGIGTMSPMKAIKILIENHLSSEDRDELARYLSPDLFAAMDLESLSEPKECEIDLEINLILRLNGKEIKV